MTCLEPWHTAAVLDNRQRACMHVCSNAVEMAQVWTAASHAQNDSRADDNAAGSGARRSCGARTAGQPINRGCAKRTSARDSGAPWLGLPSNSISTTATARPCMLGP